MPAVYQGGISCQQLYGRDLNVIAFTDGYSLETPEWRFNIRGSNTEPLLRLNIEARKAELVDQMRNQIEAIINA